MVKGVAEEVGLARSPARSRSRARSAGIKVFFVPHRRWEPGDYEGWDHVNPSQRQVQRLQPFAKDTWGGEWHPDFTPATGPHHHQGTLGSSGFANTDLDFQLKQHGLTHVIAVGLLANTCIELTGPVRHGARLPCDPVLRCDRRLQS